MHFTVTIYNTTIKEISDLKAQILAQNVEIEELKQSMNNVQNNVSCVSNYVSSESKSLRRIVEGGQVYARRKNLIFEKVKEDPVYPVWITSQVLFAEL